MLTRMMCGLTLPIRHRGDTMILTIQAPSKSRLLSGVFESSKLGVEAEIFEGNCFEIIVHRQDKLDTILKASQGTVIASREYGL